MSTSKRDRDLARQRKARQEQKEAEQAAARRRTRVIGGSIIAAVLLVIGGAAVVNALGSDGSDATQALPPLVSAPPLNCTSPAKPQDAAQQFPAGPTGVTLADATLGLDLTTNCGPIQIELDAKAAPKNATALIYLANTGAPVLKVPGDSTSGTKEVVGYYDNSPCHRLTTEGIFILQCGDPTGEGEGSPGFTTPDENLGTDFTAASGGGVIYPRGTVAMANKGPDTAGSQFFFVYKDSPLPPNYSVVGQVTKGQSIIDGIANARVADGSGDGRPAQSLVLTKVLSYETREVGTP